jgi:hypothetical protein
VQKRNEHFGAYFIHKIDSEVETVSLTESCDRQSATEATFAVIEKIFFCAKATLSEMVRHWNTKEIEA